MRTREVLAALRRSGGGTVAVSEEEIRSAARELPETTGLYVEPTSAAAAAAHSRLVTEGTIRPGQLTVLIMTGTGVKATQRFAEILGMTVQGVSLL